jgi:hypothetical protein
LQAYSQKSRALEPPDETIIPVSAGTRILPKTTRFPKRRH